MPTPPTLTTHFWQPAAEALHQLEQTHQRRQLPHYPPTLSPQQDFSSNDYLGLSRHPGVVAAAQHAAEAYGVGSTGSRLLSGNQPPIFSQLEETIAQSKGTESALLFASGYQCNSTVLPALMHPSLWGAPPIILADRLCHASLYSGIRAAQHAHPGTLFKRFRHNDMDHLAQLLEQHANNTQPVWIITESVFSMDGDLAPLSEIQRLAEGYNAAVIMDEAHATGIAGPNGFGYTPTIHWRTVPHIAIGTFSKALGCQGAYVTCPQVVKEWLINHCTGQIYSTALSPVMAAAALAAWQQLPQLEGERAHLHHLGQRLRQGLHALNINTIQGPSPIVPAIIGETSAMLALKQTLEKNNVWVAGIRPPTVPPKTARLRFSLSVHHQDSDIDHVLDTITQHTPINPTCNHTHLHEPHRQHPESSPALGPSLTG